jgi:hypothetical protein
MKISKKNKLKTYLIVTATLISLNGFCPPVNSQSSLVPVNDNRNQTEEKKTQAHKFNEISILDQILLGCLPILIGMGSMALFTFLLNFLNQYNINRFINRLFWFSCVNFCYELKQANSLSRRC